MGCCKSKDKSKDKKYPKIEDQEPEIQVEKCSSTNYKYFKEIETTFNFAKKINFMDFAYALKHFTMENATVDEDYAKAQMELFNGDFQAFFQPISEDEFSVFIGKFNLFI